MRRGDLDRRAFLAGVWSAALGLAVGGAGGLALGGCGRRAGAVRALAGLCDDLESARAVGRAHLALSPGEADVEGLLAELGGAEQVERLAREPEELRAFLAARHRDDFTSGRVVSLAGFLLSQTEVRLCAVTLYA